MSRHPLLRALDLLRFVGRHERGTLVLLFLISTGLWAFVEIADEVLEQDTESFDRAVLLALRSPDDPADPIGPRWFEEAVRDVTALGGVAVVGFLTLAVTGFLVLEGKTHAAGFVVVAVLGGWLLSVGLKEYVGRPRPALVPHSTHVMSESFPSGHSLISAVAYLTLGALVARTHPMLTVKAYALVLATLVTLLVGSSRVYLGVHWPTDVLAGWALGGSWALLCWLAAAWLQRRGRLER